MTHEFNAVGLEALVPDWDGGRPRETTDEMRARIVEVAKSPQELGELYANWSLSRLRPYLLKTRVVRRISKERLREISHPGGTHHSVHQGLEDRPRPRLRRQGGAPPAAHRAAERSLPTTASRTKWPSSSASTTSAPTSFSAGCSPAREPSPCCDWSARLPGGVPHGARTSKWNKIEHRLFSFISMNWRGKPLTTYRVIVNLIAGTTTHGLRVMAELDQRPYRPASR